MRFTISGWLLVPVVLIMALLWTLDHTIMRSEASRLWVLYDREKAVTDCWRIYPDCEPPVCDECNEALKGRK